LVTSDKQEIIKFHLTHTLYQLPELIATASLLLTKMTNRAQKIKRKFSTSALFIDQILKKFF
jgi:hypothetical protein